MLAWLAANAATIIISAILAVIVFFLIRAVVTNKVSCGGDCASCGAHPHPASGGTDPQDVNVCAHCASSSSCQAARNKE
ncbi:MAG: FeoB-associated Cys-rich membrane protein [Oscillospiraceae bacterium]|nr:FeoB-associated Cys-rich membrane protein [Oscillospiraceae bacterium]